MDKYASELRADELGTNLRFSKLGKLFSFLKAHCEANSNGVWLLLLLVLVSPSFLELVVKK
jgi:hypothetical protein